MNGIHKSHCNELFKINQRRIGWTSESFLKYRLTQMCAGVLFNMFSFLSPSPFLMLCLLLLRFGFSFHSERDWNRFIPLSPGTILLVENCVKQWQTMRAFKERRNQPGRSVPSGLSRNGNRRLRRRDALYCSRIAEAPWDNLKTLQQINKCHNKFFSRRFGFHAYLFRHCVAICLAKMKRVEVWSL